MTEHQVSDHVAESIREARKKRGWSTVELAERCGLTGNIIENIESGRRRQGERTRDVSVDELFAISAALGIGPLRLLPGRSAWPAEDRIAMAEIRNQIQQAMDELARDEKAMARADQAARGAEAEREELRDRIQKTRWLIEQLEEVGAEQYAALVLSVE